mmetsp:Transcript_8649/g.31928  ORF Transcript_8649/g.31928 Transcript_8649/m.31928 type:complete len:190 (-) Transcript_8649:478-1047(-)
MFHKPRHNHSPICNFHSLLIRALSTAYFVIDISPIFDQPSFLFHKMSFDLSNTKNTNVWRESLNREFKSRRENKNTPLTIEEVSARAKSLAQLHLQQKQEKKHSKQLKKSNEYDSLYYGLSHENTGRKAYLQRRYAKNPEERNASKNGTLTSAQEVGHGVALAKNVTKLPEHGHKGLIKKEFYSTGGAF